ncbi:SOS response-associated peptidase [Aliiroseovarius subalbicans]|uniref:SOS response-associated peptidase n=1 Tax=Aliiroseovarius subalbicans TaxID=2925840 RepID=UPI001F58C2AB|nr:SOS response-associated peptidase [Aliiroseovarius subalbicans]MCI2399164.1 SOS response-associated peptidase [Aliiroseovarius subalbicans]
MCGRFALTLPTDAMAALFGAIPANDLPIVPNFNICPTNNVHVVWTGENRRLSAMRWGFLPFWYKTPTDGPLLINARAETIAEKPAFRAACRERRCLIPTTGFYEWSKGSGGERLPWYIQRADKAPLVMAGIWQDWGEDKLPTCAIVTCAANQAIAEIHHRMPVVLEQADWAKWLGEGGHGAAPLMRPAGEDVLRFHRVDPKVNSNRASGPELVEPV